MYSLELLLVVAIGAIILGLVAGYFISQRTSPSKQSQQQLESQLSELQDKQENYQQEVSDHFVETAKLLNQMTDSYRDVHNHLAKGAQLLADNNANHSLKSLSDNSDLSIEQTQQDDELTPPSDYTPETKPDTPDITNEDFGLDNNPEETETEATKTGEAVK